VGWLCDSNFVRTAPTALLFCHVVSPRSSITCWIDTDFDVRDYATKVFGFATFGRVYGTIICVSGLINFSQIGLDSLTYGPFHDNPIPVNTILTVAGFVVGAALVSFTWIAGRRKVLEQQQEDAAYERESLIAEEPEEDDLP
jgi:hypothetical protein